MTVVFRDFVDCVGVSAGEEVVAISEFVEGVCVAVDELGRSLLK